MAEQEQEKEFEATDYDEKGNIIPAAVPPAQATKKRVTVADLKKELDELKAEIEDGALSWLGELDSRIETLEKRTAKHNETLLSDVKTRLDIIESKPPSDHADVLENIAARINNQDEAIGALADALRSYFEEPAATPPGQAEEIEFAQPPQQAEGGRATACDIISVASVCATMGDVLMICRALKADPELIDIERNEILDTACRSSGVIVTPGLKIRAGVQFSGA